tara:strand:+ start:704 stop:922 length:219 start_codon:yes stop_codon:yes gene_type:complete
LEKCLYSASIIHNIGTWNKPDILANIMQNESNEALKVAHCSNTNCTSATNTALDTGGNVGDGTSITTGSDGL